MPNIKFCWKLEERTNWGTDLETIDLYNAALIFIYVPRNEPATQFVHQKQIKFIFASRQQSCLRDNKKIKFKKRPNLFVLRVWTNLTSKNTPFLFNLSALKRHMIFALSFVSFRVFFKTNRIDFKTLSEHVNYLKRFSENALKYKGNRYSRRVVNFF